MLSRVRSLDAKVDELVGKLAAKFPEKTRYTKQQLNFWRDFSWHQTIGHGRDWLAIHNTSPETWEGVRSFAAQTPPGLWRDPPTLGGG